MNSGVVASLVSSYPDSATAHERPISGRIIHSLHGAVTMVDTSLEHFFAILGFKNFHEALDAIAVSNQPHSGGHLGPVSYGDFVKKALHSAPTNQTFEAVIDPPQDHPKHLIVQCTWLLDPNTRQPTGLSSELKLAPQTRLMGDHSQANTSLQPLNISTPSAGRDLSSLLDRLPDMVCRAWPDTTMTFANLRYAEQEGVAANELVGQRWIDRVDPAFQQAVKDSLSALTPDEPTTSVEQPVVGRDGKRRWIWWTNLMIFSDHKPYEIISVGRDVSELHEARDVIADQAKDLAHSNELLQQFSATISHDLSAPLRQISVLSDLAVTAAQSGDLTSYENWVVRIQRKSQQMSGQLKSLSRFARATHKKLKLSHAEILSVIGEALSILEGQIDERGATITLNVADNLELKCDPGLLTQVFQNLISNAIKYTPEDRRPKIVISHEWQPHDVSLFSVEDNGIGIDPTAASRLFKLFERLHADEDNYPGSGVGLVICRQIVESHKGALWLDANYKGGSRFCFTVNMNDA